MKLLLLLLLLAPTFAWGEIYQWKDSAGISHYTNQADTIPPKYKSRVKVLEMPGDGKAAPGQQPQRSSVSLPMPPPPPAAAVPQTSVKPANPAPQQRKRRHTGEE